MNRLLFLAPAVWIFSGLPVAAQMNLFVAADGSAPFKTVQDAIMSVPSGSRTNPVIIHLQPGIYHELVYLQREKRFFKLAGGNPTNTVLTFGLYAGLTNFDGKPVGTFHTSSTTIDADDFTAENVTFENSAGAVGQALAIRVDGDRACFRNCRFRGWQDTILLNRGRQYFENCQIDGAVDFIFGAATAWFEKCRLNCSGSGYIAAASTPVDQPFGFVFSNCKITGATPDVKTFLGRPWRIYASTLYLNTEMSGAVRPEGWNDWKKPEAHTTARYAEFNSTGPGASPATRPGWIKQLTGAEAEKITVAKVLGGGEGWNPVAIQNAPFGANRLNLEYGEAGGEKLLLDAHVPDGEGGFPVAILVHGGGWCSGDKETDLAPVFAPVATNFTWFTINYRLAPANRWPAGLEDVQTAMRWVKQHAAEFKGDPNRIALLGYSAGGQLAALAAMLAEQNAQVQAVVGFAPPTDLVADAQRRGSLDRWPAMKGLLGREALDDGTLKLLAEISPLHHVRPGLPPFLLIQGDTDKTVAYDLTQEFRARLQAAGVRCDLITLTNAPHRIADWVKVAPGFQAKMMSWLGEELTAETPAKR
ncbi:MAG: pectinesterase family protein [Limisphaerales bacterium]